MRGRFTENASEKPNMGNRAMTRRKKWKAGAGIVAVVLVLLLILRPWEDHRSTTREEQPAPPHREGPTPSTAKKDMGQATVAKDDQREETPAYSRLEEVGVGSISGLLIDTDGNVIENFDKKLGHMTFHIPIGSEGITTGVIIKPDGSYEVGQLSEGDYSIMAEGWEFQLGGQYYTVASLPQRVPIGTTDANIVVVNCSPGKVRGEVGDAQNMVPIRRFTVFHKLDYHSVPDRSRQCSLYAMLREDAGPVPDVDFYNKRYDLQRESLESLEPDADRDTVYGARTRLEYFRALLESHRLNIESDAGVFEQGGYLLGKHTFTVVAEGYLPKSVEVELQDAQPAEITFAMRKQGSTIAGRVEDGADEPLDAAAVEVLVPTNTEYLYSWRADAKWEKLKFVTNQSGQFVFADLPDGKYEVKATHPSYVAAAVSSVRLLDGRQEPPDLVLRMSGGDGSVWGQITGTDGSPVTGVGISVSCGSSSLSCTSDREGYYTAGGLPPGRYTMLIDRGELKQREYHFSLGPSQQLRYDIAISKSATLRGTVFTGAGGDLACWLRLVLTADTFTVARQQQKWTGMNEAQYEFTLLPPGKYELQALSDMLGIVRYSLTLSPEETKTLDIHLGRYGNLSGRVIGRDGGILAGTTISILSPGRNLSVTSDREGRYSVSDLSPGVLQLTIPAGEFAGTWFELEMRRPRAYAQIWKPDTIEPPVPDKDDKEYDIDFSVVGDVRGRVQKPDGMPLGLAALRVESPHRTVEVVTDREGRFRAKGVFPGPCRVHLSWPARARAYPFELAPQEDKELEIVLPP